MFDID